MTVLCSIAKEAGESILKVKSDYSVEYKSDGSPITLADLKANEYICRELKRHYPNVYIMSEENKDDYEERRDAEYMFVVDPLDGTKCFMDGGDDYTVNIGLLKKMGNRYVPIHGVIYVPETGDIYYTEKGNSYKNGKVIRANNKEKDLVFTISRHHIKKNVLSRLERMENLSEIIPCGSSLKGCRIAEGVYDRYYRETGTWEWDTCAVDAILRKAGGCIVSRDTGKGLVYNKAYPENSGINILGNPAPKEVYLEEISAEKAEKLGEEGAKRCAFIIPQANIQLYKGFSVVSKDIQDRHFVCFLGVNRADGKVGFPGGGVEKGESPKQAALREMKEELDFQGVDGSPKLHKIYHQVKENGKEYVIYSYLYKTSEEVMMGIIRNIHNSDHYPCEILGVHLIPAHSWGKENELGFDAYLKNHFSGSAKQELMNANPLLSKSGLYKSSKF